MGLSIRSWSMLALRTMMKEFEIVEIRVEEGVDRGSGTKYSLLPNLNL